ncbi:MAG: creatininase family protein [Thermomicrobiales bacterium]
MRDPSPDLTAGALLLADLSSPETAELLPGLDLVLIPVGAHEQHGPNSAVSTDTVSAEALCQAAAALAGPHVAVAPAIPWGISWHHMRFPGTITLRPETLTAIMEDIVASLHAHGVQCFLFVNGHGGNSAVIATACEGIKQFTGADVVAAIFGYALIAEEARKRLPASGIGHGGADEAALVMAVTPWRGKPDAATGPDLADAMPESQALLAQYGGLLARPYHERTRNGVTGDARSATPDIGREILAAASVRLAEIMAVLLREAKAAR